MLTLSFISEKAGFISAAKEYELIWKEQGNKIYKTFRELSCLDFIERTIEVVIFEGISNSGKINASPIKLRASNDHNSKIASLTHELGHRLLFGNKIKKKGLGMHQILDLILYDLWVDIYGKEFADEQVRVESDRIRPAAPYKECWEWALAMTKKERQREIKEIIKTSK